MAWRSYVHNKFRDRLASVGTLNPQPGRALSPFGAAPINHHPSTINSSLELNDAFEQARSGAFRQTVLEIYDYTCAACGLRVRLNDTLSLVEAAHLIPFNVSGDDKPTNGLALCPNHHTAMDRSLIAPCPGSKHRAGIWRVAPALDARLQGQKDLVALHGQRVIPPTEEKFFPALENLRWREQHLTTKY